MKMIHKKVRKGVYTAVISFCILFIVTHIVHAASIGIAVDQTRIAFDADTGGEEEFVITVKNISDRVQNVSVGALDYAVTDDNRINLQQDAEEGVGIKDWISTEQSRFDLAPQESRDVRFAFRVPETAVVGSHRGAVFFRTAIDESGDVNVQGQIAVHVLVNIKGDTHASGQLNNFDIPLLALGEIDYAAEFENTGNIHYVPYGEVIVRNIFSKNERSYKYPKHFVFPGKSFMFSLTDEIPSRSGLYRVHVNFVDGEGVVRTRSDYTMGPFFPLIAVAIGAVLLFVFRWVRSKRMINDKKRLDHHQKKRKSLNLQKIFDHKNRKKGMNNEEKEG